MIVYQKARIFDPASPSSGFSVQFNPNTLEYSAGTELRTQKGAVEQDAGNGQLVPEQQASPLGTALSARLSVRLFFHSYVSDLVYHDVRPAVNRIRAFLPTASAGRETSKTGTDNISPKISFAWGTMTHTGTLESFHVTYQMFAFDGTPVQAEVSITIRGEDPDVSASRGDQALDDPSGKDFSQQDDALYLSNLSWLFQ